MSNTLTTLSYMCIVESLILGFLLFLTMFGFPAWIKIAIAKIRGCQYVVKLTRDNVLTVEGAKETEGIYQSSYGVYEPEPEDSFTFNGSAGILCYGPYNRAAKAKVLPLLRDIKKAGIETYSQLLYYYQTPIETVREELGGAGAEIAKTIQSYDGKILQDVEVIRISDLKNYLESRSPAAENGIIERYISVERRKLGNPLKNGNMVIMLIMAGLLGACLGFILAGGSSGSEPQIVNTAATAAGGLTQLS